MASSVGLPVQVFPTGPPPPPPVPSKAHLAPQPPQPPAGRPSPARSPQNFEPPPMGCRPEIKIPPNPMAALKKVPKPEPKNDFWVEEYRKERSKSPMVNADGQPVGQNAASNASEERHLPEPVRQINGQDTTDRGQSPSVSADKSAETNNRNSDTSHAIADSNNVASAGEKSPRELQSEKIYESSRPIVNKNITTPQERVSSPFTSSSPTPNPPKPLSPVKSPQEPETQYYVRSTQQQPASSPAPPQNQWPPADSAHSRVLRSPGRVVQSPARAVQSPARVLSPTPRVMSPLARVMSPPPPVAQKPANLRNVITLYYKALSNRL